MIIRARVWRKKCHGKSLQIYTIPNRAYSHINMMGTYMVVLNEALGKL